MQAVTEILLDEDNYFLRNLGTNETAVLFEFHKQTGYLVLWMRA